MKFISYYFSIVTILLLGSCTCCNNKHTDENIQADVPFINPVFKGVDIPFEEFTFAAEEGDTIFYKTGSIILIPPNSLVDIDGNIVTGMVTMTYREFTEPIDFFIAGIPMQYDSADIQYTFESSGMCEINAYQNDIPVYVNSKNKPIINLATNNNDPAHNLYILDTVQKKWINEGKDVITEMATSTVKQAPNKVTKENPLTPPSKPIKATNERPIFSIVIEPGSVPELAAYNNMKFEIDDDEKNYNPRDADVEWMDVKLDKSNKSGKYIVTFINAKRKVSYLTRPVFEGKDYEEAMKTFEGKDREYQHLLSLQLTKEKNENDRIAQLNESQRWENDRIAQLNELIDARNKQTEALNKEIEAQNKEIEAQNKIIKKQRIQQLDNFIQTNNPNLETIVFRTFSLESFGIWNCDVPILQQGIDVLANFKDEAGKEIIMDNITVVYRNFNGVFRFDSNKIRTLPNSDNMIWGVKDGKFIYLSYDAYRKCNINSTTKEYSFTMKVHPKQITSYDDIKKLIEF